MSLLTTVQQAFGEIGLPVPSSVVNNTDANVVKALYLANRSGVELRDYPAAADSWPILRKQFLFNLKGVGPFIGTFTAGSPTITGITGAGLSSVLANWQVSSLFALNDTMVSSVNVGGATVTMSQNASGSGVDTNLAFGQEAYPLPSDINYEWFTPQTGWDRNFRWQLLGPVNGQEWQVLKSGISPVGPRLRYRLMAGQIFFNPAPYVPAGQTAPISNLIVMEYPSVNWIAVIAAPTVGVQSSYQLDSDISIIPEDLITLSLKWRILKALGMAWADEFSEYDDKVNMVAGRTVMGRNLPLNARASGIRLLNSQNVPDTGFGT